MGRKEPLLIYGPEGTREFTELFKALGYFNLKYEVQGIQLNPGDVVEREEYVIRALKTEHSISSLGYALVENPRPGRFNREKAIELGIPPGPLFSKLQKGKTVEVNGKLVKPEDVMGKNLRPGRTVVYSGDTRPCEPILEASRDADVLIHEVSREK